MRKTTGVNTALICLPFMLAGCTDNAEQDRFAASTRDETLVAESATPRLERLGEREAEPSDELLKNWYEFRQPEDESFASFMKAVNEANSAFRRSGIEFWKKHPTDTRRFDWLMLTAAMPPQTVDGPGKNAWRRQFASMKGEFLSSSDNTEEEKRLLRFLEIADLVQSVRSGHVKNSNLFTEQLSELIPSFVSDYNQPFDLLDERYWGNIYSSLLFDRVGILRDGGILGINAQNSAQMANELVSALRQSEHALAVGMANSIESYSEFSAAQLDESSDAQWMLLSVDNAVVPISPTLNGTIIFTYQDEISRRTKFDIGVGLWQKDDRSRLAVRWLRGVNNSFPNYYSDFGSAILAASDVSIAARDDQAVAFGISTYLSLRTKLFERPEIDDSVKGDLLFTELTRMMDQAAYHARMGHPNSVSKEVLSQMYTLCYKYGMDQRVRSFHLRTLQHSPSTFGLSRSDLAAFYRRMLDCSPDEYGRFLKSAERRVELETVPVELSGLTRTGESFDIRNLRGRIVLVEHWTTTCSACIAAMPRIREVYEKYQGQEFEVVSVVYDGVANSKRVERIERDLRLKWTTVLADDQRDELFDRFGYTSVPQYMLLNKDGTLHAGTEEIDLGRNLEALLVPLLAYESELP